MAIIRSLGGFVLLPLVLVTSGCAAGLGTVGTLGSLADLVRSLRSSEQAVQQPVQVTAEVQRVDARRQLIQVETTDGRAGGVVFDLGTAVVHEREPFPITSLAPGDLINLHLQELAQNNLYASRIEVVQLASEAEAGAEAEGRPVGGPVGAVARELGGEYDTADAVKEVAPTRAAPTEPERAASPPGGLLPAGVHRVTGKVGRIEAEQGRFELVSESRPAITVSLPYNPPRSVADRFGRLERGDTVRVEVETLSQARVELRRFLEEE